MLNNSRTNINIHNKVSNLLIIGFELNHIIKAIMGVALYTQNDVEIGYLPIGGYWHTTSQIYFTYLLFIIGLLLSLYLTRITRRLIRVEKCK